MEIIYIVIGMVIGAVITYLMTRSRSAVRIAMLEQEKEQQTRALAQARVEFAQRMQEEKDEMAATHAKEQAIITAHFAEQKQTAQQQLADMKQEHANTITMLRQENDEALEWLRQEHANDLSRAKQEADERREKELADLRQRFDSQMRLFKEEVQTVTEKMLKERGEELRSTNVEQMEQMFKPLKDNIASMEKSINDSREASARNSASFEKSMLDMMQRTQTLGEQADRLSNALQRKNKVAGNWGELVLSDLLESQGLVQGEQFDTQFTLKDADGHTIYNEETGSRMIPDVVLHLPDSRDVIVDAKMSLTAFTDYQNADTEEEKADALKRHLESLRSHVRELTTKRYQEYIVRPRVSSDFVIMFVPIEGALQVALNAEPTLWREAFDKKVFIASGQTLLAALRVIELSWVNVRQERNTQRIMDEARKLVERVEQFYDRFQTVGKCIDNAREAYLNVQDKVRDGRQSILGAGRNLEDLGVRGKKALPRAGE